MSAIFGIIDVQSRHISEAWTSSIEHDLCHRGPDGVNTYGEAGVVLGHLLLKVSPSDEFEIGPYADGDLIIVANARLDARKELMAALQLTEADAMIVTDTQLLLRAYKQWGAGFVKKIYGDFSFAIWNKKERQLFCGRDAIGVKPLFYYFADGRFVFSTELRAIVNLPFVHTTLDHHYLRNRAVAICDQPTHSSWKNIIRLQPAHTLLLQDGKIQTEQFWKPVYKRNKRFKTSSQSAAALRELLHTIMADHITVSGNVGASLSGGLDSGTISCLAAQQLQKKGKKLFTASSVYGDGGSTSPERDEMEYINAVLGQEKNIVPAFVPHHQHSFVNTLEQKLQRNYAPVNAFYYVDAALYQQFQERGVRRVLSGYLGDLGATNSSINPFSMLLGAGRFGSLRTLLAAYQRSDPEQTSTALLKHSVLSEFTPAWFRHSWNKLKGRTPTSRLLTELPLLLGKDDAGVLQAKLDETFNFPSRKPSDILYHIWPATVYLFDEEEDCAASHHQLEVTYPLCDRRLIELLLQLPPEHFYAAGIKRGLIRTAMAGILPDKVRLRKTKGSYSPGYTQLIEKEIAQIIAISDTVRDNVALKALVDEQKLKISLKNLPESKFEDSFAYLNWTLIEIIIWIQCTKSLEKVKQQA